MDRIELRTSPNHYRATARDPSNPNAAASGSLASFRLHRPERLSLRIHGGWTRLRDGFDQELKTSFDDRAAQCPCPRLLGNRPAFDSSNNKKRTRRFRGIHLR